MEYANTIAQDIHVAGIQPLTTIDFPGRTAAVLFMQGCSWNCRYCHNPSCKDVNSPGNVSWEYLEPFLIERVGFLDGIVLSGGEPTINPLLPAFLEKIREFGYETALHTNGCNPDMLKLLIKRKLVDYIAMDVKAPPALYENITRRANTGILAARSISVILSCKVDYEFRTTYHPALLSENDLMDTVHAVHNSGARRYFIQRFHIQGVSDRELAQSGDVVDVPAAVVEEASKLFDVFEVR